jgi:hypothetical protein
MIQNVGAGLKPARIFAAENAMGRFKICPYDVTNAKEKEPP